MGLLYGLDNVTVGALDAGYAVYGGYTNGSYPNMTALRARFGNSGAKLIGFSVRADKFEADAEAIDCEAGTYSSSLAGNQVAAHKFLNQWKPEGKSTDKPVVYVMGSWAQNMVNYLAAYGWDRSRYYIMPAHYAGKHLCGPTTCGLLRVAADATQYATGRNDWDIFNSYMFGGAPAPVTPVAPAPVSAPPVTVVKEGAIGPSVKEIQVLLNDWQPVAWNYAPVLEDSDFGGITLAAVRAFQEWAKLGVDGEVGPETLAALTKALPRPVPARGVTFAHPQALTVKPGRTNFIAAWKQPAGVAKGQAVPYQVYVYEGTPERASLVPSYPREIGATTAAVLKSEPGSLTRGTSYVLHVVAGTGTQVRPWDYAVVTFKTA